MRWADLPDDVRSWVDVQLGSPVVAAIDEPGGFSPAPPGLPTIRAFQAAQGVVARAWVQQRTGWV